jgi:hypothetical protein
MTPRGAIADDIGHAAFTHFLDPVVGLSRSSCRGRKTSHSKFKSIDCSLPENKLFDFRFIIQRHRRPHLRRGSPARSRGPPEPQKFGAIVVKGDVI